jgi:hypothetical protein
MLAPLSLALSAGFLVQPPMVHQSHAAAVSCRVGPTFMQQELSEWEKYQQSRSGAEMEAIETEYKKVRCAAEAWPWACARSISLARPTTPTHPHPRRAVQGHRSGV